MHNLSIFHISSGQKRKQTFAFSNSLFLDESELANKKIHIDNKLFNHDFFSIPEPPQNILFFGTTVDFPEKQKQRNNETSYQPRHLFTPPFPLFKGVVFTLVQGKEAVGGREEH